MTQPLSQYLITQTGAEALEYYDMFSDTSSVRYAALLADGRGLIARDLGSSAFGIAGARIWDQQEPHPDYPDTWPDWVRKGGRAPKRARMTGREVFSLLPWDERVFNYLADQETVTGLARVKAGDGEEAILVESDGVVTIGAIWSVAALEARDRRVRAVLDKLVNA